MMRNSTRVRDLWEFLGRRPKGLSILLGILFVSVGVLLNKWSMQWLFSADNDLSSIPKLTVIGVFQFGCIAAGLWFVFKKPIRSISISIGNVTTAGLVVGVLVGGYGSLGTLAFPPVDYSVWTLPDFHCNGSDQMCNLTQASGLGGLPGYGKGAAFVDINGDGWDDLFVTDADPRLGDSALTRFKPSEYVTSGASFICDLNVVCTVTQDDVLSGAFGNSGGYGLSKMYLNNGDGTFQLTDVGFSDVDLYATWAASFADYDNDGDPDVLLVNGGYEAFSYLAFYENRMNEIGRFVSVTSAAGIDVANDTQSPWWGASWADYDNDGFADLVVTRREGSTLLFHNNGDRTFTEIGVAIGIDLVFGVDDDGKNPVWFDYDGDGDPDLYIAGIQKHAFYKNMDGEQFVDVTAQVFDAPFPAYPGEGLVQSAPLVFAAAAADFNQDGRDDLYLGRWTEQDLVLINDGSGRFRQVGREFGIDALNTRSEDNTRPLENTMGLGLGDLSDDGYPDIFIGSGDPRRADRDILYCNQAGTGFVRCTEMLTSGATSPYRTRAHGAVFADVNHDGKTDLFLNLGGHAIWDATKNRDNREQTALYVRQPGGTVSTATIVLQGTASNRDAIGARVRVNGTETHYYTVRSTQGFQSQNSNALVVTLGDATSGDVEIRWPSGRITQLSVDAGERVHVIE